MHTDMAHISPSTVRHQDRLTPSRLPERSRSHSVQIGTFDSSVLAFTATLFVALRTVRSAVSSLSTATARVAVAAILVTLPMFFSHRCKTDPLSRQISHVVCTP